MRFRILLCVVIAFALPGCKTQSALTSKATGCRTMSVDIVKSRYAREGSTTVWCAKCREKLYLCISSPDHARIQCKEAAPDLCD